MRNKSRCQTCDAVGVTSDELRLVVVMFGGDLSSYISASSVRFSTLVVTDSFVLLLKTIVGSLTEIRVWEYSCRTKAGREISAVFSIVYYFKVILKKRIFGLENT